MKRKSIVATRDAAVAAQTRLPSVQAQLAQAQLLAVATPFNANKGLEVGRGNAVAPPRGAYRGPAMTRYRYFSFTGSGAAPGASGSGVVL